MQLHELKKSAWKKRKSLRRGRGNSSGRGNYSTRGLKGQKARSGYSRSAGFEGGQTALHMRLPKLKGFKRYFKLQDEMQVVNLGALQKSDKIADGAAVTIEMLVDAGLIRKTQKVKVLWTGECTKKLTFDEKFIFSNPAKKALGI